MQDAGLPYNPPTKYAKADPERAKRIAQAFEEMPHNPDHPLVKASYQQLAKEVADQYKAAVNAGAKFEFWDPETQEDPYAASPRLAVEDLRKNHHMYVFPTSAGYGSDMSEEDIRQNPLLADSGERWNGKPVTYNDMFRAVHDYFGHGKDGVGFRADGEENAWRSHAAMFSPLARLAMTTETRGQNSWLNYGPHGDTNRTAGVEDTIFADQKAGVLPLWAHHEGAEDFMHPDDVAAMGQLYDRPGRADGGPVQQPQPDDNGFYSHAEYAAQNLPQAKGSPEQMRAMLVKAGVKPDEMKWTQLDNWMQTQPVVTRDAMVNHLRQNRVQVGETQLGRVPGDVVGAPVRQIGGTYHVDTPRGQYRLVPYTYGEGSEEPETAYTVGFPDGSYERYHNFDTIEEGLDHIRQHLGDASDNTRYSEETIPGGQNYREVLLTKAAQGGGDSYHSSHWNEPNVLAHLRMSDRNVDDKKVLHLEELQSDWGQEGRRKGFKDTSRDWTKDHDDFRQKMVNDWVEKKAAKAMETNPELFGDTERAREAARMSVPHYGARRIADDMGVADEYDRLYEAMDKHRNGIPPGPFVDNTEKWTRLGLKRALIEAANGGYDRIAWTPGQEQADRYNLAKKVSRVYLSNPVWHGENDVRGELVATDHNGNDIITKPVASRADIEELIGKDAGARLVDSPTTMEGRNHVLHGDGLRVGGEGMKGFYDKIVPTQLKKLAKELGEEAKFGTTQIEHQDENGRRLVPVDAPHIEITPAMREKIKKGLPLFADGGAVNPDEDGIVAYHGTPHDFDQFDLSKVGSGQGEQAYGHGLYFASNEDLARSYRDDLSSGVQMIDGRPAPDMARDGYGLDEISPEHEIASFVSQYGRQARDVMRIRAPHLLDQFDAMQGSGRIQPGGKMYEVGINAHPDHILDWDKPIIDQPYVAQALANKHINLDPSHPRFEALDQAHKSMMSERSKGAHAHYYLRKVLGNQGASDYLSDAGVRGIKYLDGGDRGVGEGTHNYVIFDDKLVNVRKKYAYGGRANERDNVWWHGSVNGDMRGGKTGLHLGTKAAAEDALHARIGFPAEGDWDGTREYGKTLLAGKKRILERNQYGITGRNVSAPDEDYYAHEHPEGPLKHWNGDEIDPSVKPSIKPFRIKGPMTNSVYRPHGDWKANGYMQAALKRGNAKSGYFYKNEAEDSGSISAVVPNGDHVEPAILDGAPDGDRTARFAGGRVETNPTDAQKEAGNYRKGHTTFQGLGITIENPKGSKRSGVDGGGKRWSVTMPAHYGYIKRTEGADGDHVDVYLGPSKDSKRVFVVDQQDHRTKAFDEHKVMLGYEREADALAAYKRAFSDGNGGARIKHVTEMSIGEFKIWLRHCNTKKPVKSRAIVDRALSVLSRKS